MDNAAPMQIGKDGFDFDTQWLHLRIATLVGASASMYAPGTAWQAPVYDSGTDAYRYEFTYGNIPIRLMLPGAAIRNPDHDDSITSYWLGVELLHSLERLAIDWRDRYRRS